jgi:hypothetical protein
MEPKKRRRFVNVKRDMELARDLLRQVETGDHFNGTEGYDVTAFDHGDHSSEEVAFHLAMLIDANLLKGTLVYDIPVVTRLTWEGCEFLDNTRNPDVWKTVKEQAQKLGGAGIAVLGELAKAEIKKRLGLQ